MNRIIKAVNTGDLPITPQAKSGCLGKDKWGDPPQGTYSYALVIKMQQYLQGHMA
jgi:hypothetical protein